MIPILRLIHIVSGVFWVGSVLFVSVMLLPSIRRAGPSGGAVMSDLGRRMPPIMMGAALLTVGAGIWLMTIVSGGHVGAWMQSSMGRTIGIGGGLAILAIVLGLVINAPTGRRMSVIGAAIAKRGGPPEPGEAAELQRLQARMEMASVAVAVLLLLATCAMAVARYMP